MNIIGSGFSKEATIKHLTTMISNSVKTGRYTRSYVGEEPTLERLKASLPQMALGIPSEEDYDEVVETVYKKLRKSGILARIRESA